MLTSFITGLGWVLVLGAAAGFLLGKSLFLAPCRAGFLMVLANLVHEVAERRLSLRRPAVDAAWGLAVVAGGWAVGGAAVAALLAVVLGAAWIAALFADLRARAGRFAWPFSPLDTGRVPVPLPIPRLILRIEGPVLARKCGGLDLGDWPAGLEQAFVLRILNPSVVWPQLPLAVSFKVAGTGLELTAGESREVQAPGTGEVVDIPFKLRAVAGGAGGELRVKTVIGDVEWSQRLCLRSVMNSQAPVRAATIRRWKNGAHAAFIWRGDQDLYDPSTFQNEEGLRATLGLARRFRMPSSLMLSARLSLVPEEHKAFCAQFGWNRKTDEIPSFIRFLREQVDVEPDQEWPTATAKPLAMEVGNHYYLHYGTHAAADVHNGWAMNSAIGAGDYPWLAEKPPTLFSEQRDNAAKGSQVLEEAIGQRPASFTIPCDIWNADTARAMEAAGLEVGSETDASKIEKLLWLSPPHHPAGTERFVELPRMHPRDPENIFQLAIMKYWVGHARRTGRSLVFLAHHHLTRYEGEASFHFVEELLRHVLADQDGDLFVGTLTAVGRYWRDVLSDRTRCVRVSVAAGTVTVENTGPRDLSGLPLEIELEGGRRFLKLISLRAGQSLRVAVS